MGFIFTLLASFITNLSESFNNIIKVQEKKLNISKLSLLKSSYSLSFLIAFLLANTSSMSAIIFKDALGTIGLIFPISSSLLLYIIAIISIKNMMFYSKEEQFYKRELEENTTEND